MWQINYYKGAVKQLAKLPPETQAAIREGLQNERWVHLPRRIGGGGGVFAIPSIMPVRIGDYRILCNISSTADEVEVTDVRYEPR